MIPILQPVTGLYVLTYLRNMSHSEGNDTDQEGAMFHCIPVSFPIWEMEPNNSICPHGNWKTGGQHWQCAIYSIQKNYPDECLCQAYKDYN